MENIGLRFPFVFAVIISAATAAGGIGELPADATVVVSPLTSAMWNQGRHYNLMCPTTRSGGSDGRMWSGCTAVAMAIILDYYQWPLQGTGDTRADEAYWSADTISQRARFDSSYDWNAVRRSYGHVVSARESLAIGTLMSDVGAILNMNYGSSGSSTTFDRVPGTLGSNFYFDNSYAPSVREFNAANVARMKAQLEEGHPIPCSGTANAQGTGHTYVCDGYATTSPVHGTVTNLFHFNFGWGGVNNGWYPLDSVFTSATPGQEAEAHPVDEVYLNVYPQRAPQFARVPQVIAPDHVFRWAIATCWTNRLEKFVLERQELQSVQVQDELVSTDWAMHKMGEDTCGWSVSDDEVRARIYDWGDWGVYWPGMGNCIGATRGFSISADTVITVKYQAIGLPIGIELKLTRCYYDDNVGEWDDHDSSWNLRALTTLPCGSSTSSLDSKTVVIKGSEILSALGGDLTDVHFSINFDNPSFKDPTFAANTEIFRLESFTVSGEAEDWVSVETNELAASARDMAFAGLAEGRHRMKLIAGCSDGDFAAVQEVEVSGSVRPPSAVAVETNANSVVFEVADAESFGYGFEYQSNALKGSPTVDGNRITWTFDNDLSPLGTHWLTLTVSNRLNGLVGKCVHITNPPEDHPLCAYREDAIAAAADRALREGKLVMLVQSGDPESSKFANLSGILASNEVARVIAERFVLVEADTATAEGRQLGKAYWRGQPQVGYGSGLTAYQPTITAYVTVISPTNAAVPYACDALPSYYMNANSRWSYFNSQYDLTNLGYDFYVNAAVSGLVSFMGQSGFITTPLAPSFEDAVLIVSADGVRLEFSSLPGLRYTLLRGLTPESVTNQLETTGASNTAVSNRVVLIDVSADRPTSGAFYRVRVDVP